MFGHKPAHNDHATHIPKDIHHRADSIDNPVEGKEDRDRGKWDVDDTEDNDEADHAGFGDASFGHAT